MEGENTPPTPPSGKRLKLFPFSLGLPLFQIVIFLAIAHETFYVFVAHKFCDLSISQNFSSKTQKFIFPQKVLNLQYFVSLAQCPVQFLTEPSPSGQARKEQTTALRTFCR